MYKTIAWLLVLAGTLSGPVYWIYANQFSTEVAATLPLQAQADGRYQSPEFRLSPDMNPIGLIFDSGARRTPEMAGIEPRNVYEAILTRGSEAAQPVKFGLALKPGKEVHAFHERLVLLSVKEAESYRLTVQPLTQPAFAIDAPSLVVQQKIVTPNPSVVSGGIIAIGVGLLMLLM